MSERRIVQIAAAAVPSSGGQHDVHFVLYALADDGTLWAHACGSWDLLPALPPAPPETFGPQDAKGGA